MKLKDVIDIRSGLFSKSQVNPDLYYIQSTDIDKNGEWRNHMKHTISMEGNLRKHVLNPSDVLFTSKGKDFFAIVYNGKYSPAVASTTFLVLVPDQKIISSQFLVWFLNHPKTIALFKNTTQGMSLPMISKASLQEIEIEIPPMKLQDTIVKLNNLQIHQRGLLRQLEKLRDENLNNLIYKFYQNAKKSS